MEAPVYNLSHVLSLHNTTTKCFGFTFDSTSWIWIQERRLYIWLISIPWAILPFLPFLRWYGTPSSAGSNPSTSLGVGDAFLESKDTESDEEWDDCLGKEGGDGVYGGGVFTRELFAVGESIVEDDEVYKSRKNRCDNSE